jgi:hypothetical protein
MSRAKASGHNLTNRDASIVLGMEARGDRDHDIAAWFGVNQGRIADVNAGKYGSIGAAPNNELPPKGPPGVKGRRLRTSVGKALDVLTAKGETGAAEALQILQAGQALYDANEA